MWLNEKIIIQNVEKFSQTVKVNISEAKVIMKNLSRNAIQVGGLMFHALNVCPSFNLKLYFKAIYGGNEVKRVAMIALKMIKKEKGSNRMDAIKIFDKISSVLGFEYIFKYTKYTK